ncbi:uncharacterized protein A1O9_04770 [Exophiala aquamarina CBS 119918]|uniref:Enoyl reductase (ER) domain-containing protein n=1 Tax=Exophiala aquamarina CBS 119918 TaxID=1182545 RepID=A0A072PJJ8_9EURO|nr:uncharacterized protein A1O9_04770 [Exophiala aquamarina CBS 119918]KEF59922.1 hypothetical protein A1O9_04770 [Exophiala aquamarina CBS 119918]
MMRGWTFTRRGTPSAVLKLRSDLPKPTPAQLHADEVIVKVSHVAIDQGVAALMGLFPHLNSKPWIPGLDFSGVVDAVGSNVTHVRPGDMVFGSPNPKANPLWGRKYNGTIVEYAILPAGLVVRKPPNISIEAASTLACNGCTAVQFIELAGMKRGDRVLITGASGGLGTLMIQAVRAAVGDEGTIVGTCSVANEELVKKLGANEVIDYRAHPVLHEHLRTKYSTDPFNSIIDIAGNDELLYDKSPGYMKPDGVFILGGKMSVTHGGGSVGFLSILGFALNFTLKTCRPLLLGGTPRKGLFHSANITPDSIRKTAALVEAGHLTGTIDTEYAMEDALKAFEAVARGRARGKYLIRVQDVPN